MRSPEARRVAILAGGGSLPREIAESLIESGAHVHIIAIDGSADPSPVPCQRTTVDFAQIGKILSVLKSDALTEMLIIGAVSRPDLGAIRPDLGFFLALPTVVRLVWAGGDDAVLRGVIEFFERRGVEIVGPADVAPELIVSPGPFGRHSAPSEERAGIAKALAIIKSLAPFDVGQAVVIAQGRVEAIEGVEGTDRILQRVTALRAERKAAGAVASSGVLVKAPKPGQELRIDLPAIGPDTIHGVAAAGLSGIAVSAGYVLAAERAALRALADGKKIFVEGVEADVSVPDDAGPALSLGTVGCGSPSRQQQADCIKGGQVIATLARHDVAAGVAVVHRSHVLAVETGEGIGRALARARELRQWGRRLRSRRSGVAVLASDRDLDDTLIENAAAAGLAGIAVMLGSTSAAVSQAAIDAANGRRLFIVTLITGQGERG